jgi:hypothetical protein
LWKTPQSFIWKVARGDAVDKAQPQGEDTNISELLALAFVRVFFVFLCSLLTMTSNERAIRRTYAQLRKAKLL